MSEYEWLQEYCLARFGSPAKLEALLPRPGSPEQLLNLTDDRYLSLISLRVFRAGLKHSVVDAKWPAFEEAFYGFEPEKVQLMGADHLERLMHDARLIRHLGKLKSVPRNASMVLDIRREYGSFGQMLDQWPVTDITGLWRMLAKRGDQLGGLSAPRFLRMAGKDTFVLSEDVVTALKGRGVIDRAATSQKALAAIQGYFNDLRASSGRPLCQLSVMLAHTVNH